MKRNYQSLTKGILWETDDQKIDESTLQTSAILRIADATEVMAQNYGAIIKTKEQAERDRDKYYRWYQEEKARAEKLTRRLAAQKGVATRIKNKSEQI